MSSTHDHEPHNRDDSALDINHVDTTSTQAQTEALVVRERLSVEERAAVARLLDDGCPNCSEDE